MPEAPSEPSLAKGKRNASVLDPVDQSSKGSSSSRAKGKRPTRKPIQTATVIESAVDIPKQSASSVDEKVLEKIQKCLARAQHPNTSEAEAKSALYVSQKLMSQYNVTQADLIANESANNRGHFGGRSKVAITKVPGSKSTKVITEAFTWKLATAMSTYFDCKEYSVYLTTRVQWVFFGIASNTAAAAMGFEMAHNKILDWSCKLKGGQSTSSYRLGVADGLVAIARRLKKTELENANRKELDAISAREREEANERQNQLDRLQPMPSGSADSDSTSRGHAYSAPLSPDFSMPDITPGPGGNPSGKLGAGSAGPNSVPAPVQAPATLGPHPTMSDIGAGSDTESNGTFGFGIQGSVPSTLDPNVPDLDVDSEDDIDEIWGSGIQADFNASDAQIIDLCDDIDELIDQLIKPEPSEPLKPIQQIPGFGSNPEPSIKPDITIKPDPTIKTEPELESIPAESPWESGMQLTRFRTTSMQVADDYLKENNIKLSYARGSSGNVGDFDAYRQGQRDSAKINIQGN